MRTPRSGSSGNVWRTSHSTSPMDSPARSGTANVVDVVALVAAGKPLIVTTVTLGSTVDAERPRTAATVDDVAGPVLVVVPCGTVASGPASARGVAEVWALPRVAAGAGEQLTSRPRGPRPARKRCRRFMLPPPFWPCASGR